MTASPDPLEDRFSPPTDSDRGALIVTGGAGFIGTNFVRSALAETEEDGRSIVVLDVLTYAGHLANLLELADHPRLRFIRGDIADRKLVRRLFGDILPSAVVNFAAESHVDRSIDGPGAFVRTNVLGTFELLEACRGLRSELPEGFRFVHVSTDEVYGSLGSEGLFSETTPYSPSSPYSASKASADHFVHAYHETYGLDAVITNCSNNYGPYQFPEKLIPLMILNAVAGRELPIYGDGSNIRDWIHVEDHCRGVWLALTRGRSGQKYNLGGGNERTNLQVVDAICDAVELLRPASQSPALKAGEKTSYRELRRFVTDRPGHDFRYAIDATKSRRELEWRPRHDFESGLEATVAWYLEHAAWCDRVQHQNDERERKGLG